MNLFQAVSFKPQLASVEHGKEPSIREMMLYYYTTHDVPSKTAEALVQQYLGEIYGTLGD